MKEFIFVVCIFFSSFAFSTTATPGYTKTGLVEFIELVRAQGFMVKGDLGDAAQCGTAGYLWVPIEHPQYDKLYSTVLAAYMSGKKIYAFAHACSDIGWHGGSFSTLNGAGALYIKN